MLPARERTRIPAPDAQQHTGLDAKIAETSEREKGRSTSSMIPRSEENECFHNGWRFSGMTYLNGSASLSREVHAVSESDTVRDVNPSIGPAGGRNR
jgi:hypothetical protein